MADAETTLRDRARDAYEAGRLLLGLRRAAVVLPMTALSFAVCDHPVATAVDGGLLTLLVALCAWRGAGFGRGARIGLWAGAPPLLLPTLVEAAGRVCCGASFCSPTLCIAGGIAGGALLGVWALRRPLDAATLGAAALVAGLAGTLGCLLLGASGVAGLVAGLGVGATPLLVLRRA